MNQNELPDLHMNVADLLVDWPQVIPVFLQHRMACVGCSMSGFETVGDAARIYGLSPDSFLVELHHAILAANSPSEGES
jgi:hybrid cluster-associated redox disulfide protein